MSSDLEARVERLEEELGIEPEPEHRYVDLYHGGDRHLFETTVDDIVSIARNDGRHPMAVTTESRGTYYVNRIEGDFE